MTQLFPILLMAIVLAGDNGLTLWPTRPSFSVAQSSAVALVPVLLIVGAFWLVVRWCLWRLSRHRSPAPIIVADRAQQMGRWLLLLTHLVACFCFDWVPAVRSVVGNLILVDEIVAILPALLGLHALWWMHYPIERRLREAMLMRRLDRGDPIYRIPRRTTYVLEQSRLHVMLLLVPLLLIVGLAEAIGRGLDRFVANGLPEWGADVATFASALTVFVLSPLIARRVLDARPLAEGPVRDDLTEICTRHRVRVREFLLWNTNGLMMNAAVMGLLGPLRYVLLTDTLLDNMAPEQMRAVMAHEVGHVRRHHLPWMVASLIALLVLGSLLVTMPFAMAERMGARWTGSTLVWMDGAMTIAVGLFVLLVFGWLSRRYERQADTFAVQHLSGLGVDEPDPESTPGCVTEEAVAAMGTALDSVARTNTVDPRRRSWRHGSIAWRQAYLRSIVGRPLNRLPIDRLIRWVKVGSALVLVGGVALSIVEYQREVRSKTQTNGSLVQEAFP